MSEWNCRPPDGLSFPLRTAYLAGYSDGFHGARYGAGHEDPPSTYRLGFDEGRVDAKKERRT